jgi:hypothetical protein
MRLDSQQRRQLHLLEWLLDEGGGGHDVAPFYANVELSPDFARHDLRQLEARGFVDAYFLGRRGRQRNAQARRSGSRRGVASSSECQARTPERLPQRVVALAIAERSRL